MENRLEELRKEKGIKQEELAEAMGVSRQTIGSLENGRYNPFKNAAREAGFEENTREMLLDVISMACGAFEQLPCLSYIDILRNILYAGVWNRYDYIHAKKKEDKK